MKKQLTIREQLGLKQEELAQLLQVTRSQLSLYEIGKRKLPTHATEKLANLLSLAQNETTDFELEAKNEQINQSFLQRLLVKNQHQQLLVEKKLVAMQKKEYATKASNKIVNHLKEQAKTKKEIKLIESLTLKKQDEKNAEGLVQLQIKIEVLAFEEKLLKNV
ncbi:helix-turn-helix domain-containing protein [Flavobacterium piscinae]|uniref:helix-turn-helix domain-containing protein n=1 Tax=Flavobacterium piscinae TaxID=2506424 RepID=UPI00199059D0|nr:helix-turn-helix transcriptional regulator [Flavobacterium piscinae]MBC8883727.1 helix-turn-helix domain-containing protein [Flavobacterium piscinae]